MVSKKAKGKRAKTRSKLKRKGHKASVNKLLQDLKTGTTVQIKIDSSIHSGIPSARYQGLTATVKGKRGLAYTLELKEGNLSKYLIVHPGHLSIVKETVGEDD